MRVGGVLPPRVERSRGDHGAVQIGDVVQLAGEHVDFIRFAGHRDLGADHVGAVIQARHQMERDAADGPGAAQGLAVHASTGRSPMPGGPRAGAVTQEPWARSSAAEPTAFSTSQIVTRSGTATPCPARRSGPASTAHSAIAA